MFRFVEEETLLVLVTDNLALLYQNRPENILCLHRVTEL